TARTTWWSRPVLPVGVPLLVHAGEPELQRPGLPCRPGSVRSVGKGRYGGRPPAEAGRGERSSLPASGRGGVPSTQGVAMPRKRTSTEKRPGTVYDAACAFLMHLEVALLWWLLGLSAEEVQFDSWLKTDNLPWPGQPKRTCDTVACLR